MHVLYVCNLAYKTTSDDLRRFLDNYGFEDFTGDIYIPKDYYTRQPKGYGFVRFYVNDDVQTIIDTLDGQLLDGRNIRFRVAKSVEPPSHVEFGRRGRTVNIPRGRSRSRSHDRKTRRSRSGERKSPRRPKSPNYELTHRYWDLNVDGSKSRSKDKSRSSRETPSTSSSSRKRREEEKRSKLKSKINDDSAEKSAAQTTRDRKSRTNH